MLVVFFKKKENTFDHNFVKSIYKKGKIVRYITFIVGLFLVSFAFNVFLLPSEVVYGVGGVAVILNKLYQLDPSLVIMIGSIILLFLSLIFLGKEKTANTVVGSLLYPIFVKLTEPMISMIDLGSTEPVVIALFGAAISGFGLGMIFKAGFTTGGTDILNQIVSKYFKMSIGNSMFFTDGVIVFASIFVFGFQKFMYSVISIYLISVMTDKVILGISNSKAFYIITKHETEVKKFVMDYLSHGVTVLEGRGGYTGDRQKVIMCIIPTKEYFMAKEGIKKIDPKAFFLVTDAYEFSGGE